jgi:hypothetical protein
MFIISSYARSAKLVHLRWNHLGHKSQPTFFKSLSSVSLSISQLHSTQFSLFLALSSSSFECFFFGFLIRFVFPFCNLFSALRLSLSAFLFCLAFASCCFFASLILRKVLKLSDDIAAGAFSADFFRFPPEDLRGVGQNRCL